MQGLGLLHLRPTFQKIVRQHDRWKALLTVEIGKAESLMEKENLKQNMRDDRRDIGKKNEIFKHGIKGIKKITGKYNTSKLLTEIKISCPCGLKWTCVVTAWVRSMVESQSSGCSKIRIAPTSGGFLINSKKSSFSRFMSLRILGSLDACGTENLSLSGINFVISSCSVSGCSSPQMWGMVSIFPLICAVGSV